MFDWLVVTGPEAGNVWQDRRSDKLGLVPVEVDGRRVDFEKYLEMKLPEATDGRHK